MKAEARVDKRGWFGKNINFNFWKPNNWETSLRYNFLTKKNNGFIIPRIVNECFVRFSLRV